MDDELDAAIGFPPGFGGVGFDRPRRAESLRDQPFARYAVARDVLQHGFGATIRERLVVVVRSFRGGMPLDGDAEALVVLQRLRYLIEGRVRDGFDDAVIPRELDLLFQLELVRFDDDLLVDGATVIRGRPADVGARGHVVRNTIPIRVRGAGNRG